MSISQNPMTGQMRKSMANFTTYVYKGQNIIRSKAFNPKDANTELQKVQRASFKLIVNAYQSLGGFADNGFPLRPDTQSVYNAFVAANLLSAIDNTGTIPVIDYRKMLIAKGTLQGVKVTSAVVNASGITVNYATNLSFPHIATTDMVMVVAKTKEGALMSASQQRGSDPTGSISLVSPNISKDDIDYVYLFVITADKKNVSNSVFVELG
jgi:hypothetical protein